MRRATRALLKSLRRVCRPLLFVSPACLLVWSSCRAGAPRLRECRAAPALLSLDGHQRTLRLRGPCRAASLQAGPARSQPGRRASARSALTGGGPRARRQAFEADARAHTGTAPDGWMVPPSGGSGGAAASSGGTPDESTAGLAAAQAAAPLPADAAHESRAAQAHSNGLTAAAHEARPAGGPSTAAAAAQQQGTNAPHPAAPARAADALHMNGAATACAPPAQATERRAPSTQAHERPPEAAATPSAPAVDALERLGGAAEPGRAGGSLVTEGEAQHAAEPGQRAHASPAAGGGPGGGPARPPPPGDAAAQPAQSGEAVEHARSGGSAGAAQQALQPAARAPGSVAAAQREPSWLARREVFIAVTAGMRQQVFRFQPGQRSWLAWQVRGRPGLPAAARHAVHHGGIMHCAGRRRRHASFAPVAHVPTWRQGLLRSTQAC